MLSETGPAYFLWLISARMSLKFIFYGIWKTESIKQEGASEHVWEFQIHLNHKPSHGSNIKAVLEDSDRFEQKVIVGTLSLGRQVSFHFGFPTSPYHLPCSFLPNKDQSSRTLSRHATSSDHVDMYLLHVFNHAWLIAYIYVHGCFISFFFGQLKLNKKQAMF